MNFLFTALFLLCSARLLYVSPQNFLPSLLSAASASATLCVALLSSYAVFCGLSALWEKSGLASAIGRRLRYPLRTLFRWDEEQFAQCVCLNVSANLLGIGAIATPYGVRAARLLDGSSAINEPQREYAMAMLFTLNAASLQLIPTSVIALRTAAGSVSPSSVVLPILLSSVFFLAFALPITALTYRRGKRCKAAYPPVENRKSINNSGGIIRNVGCKNRSQNGKRRRAQI